MGVASDERDWIKPRGMPRGFSFFRHAVAPLFAFGV